MEAARRRLEEVEREIVNIMAAIKAGILTPTTKTELEGAEAERERLRSQTSGNGKIAELLPQAAAKLRQMVEGLEKTAGRDIPFVRSRLKIVFKGGSCCTRLRKATWKPNWPAIMPAWFSWSQETPRITA